MRKKDGSLCFCIDFHHLNTHTEKDSYPLLRIKEALDRMVSADHFSCLDLESGSGQSKWMSLPKSILCLLLATEASLSVTTSLLVCAMHWPSSSG